MVSADMCEHDWPGSGCKECFPPEEIVRRAMSGELKSCPFCGGEAHWTPTYFDSDFPGTVDCECGATVIIGGTKAERIAAWNTRAELSSLRGEGQGTDVIGRLVGALDLLEKAAREVHSKGAVTGPQWPKLAGALVRARQALASIPTPDAKP